MKIHLVSTLLVGLVGSGIPLGLAEKVTLIFCVQLVLFAEMLNAALESLVDLHSDKRSHLGKDVKDLAAGAVLLLATGTTVVFLAFLVHEWEVVVANSEQVGRQFAVGIPLAITSSLLLWSKPRAPWLNAALGYEGDPAFNGGRRYRGFLALEKGAAE